MSCQGNIRYKDVVARINAMRLILVHHHTFAWGPSHALGEYLSGKGETFIFIEHPFHTRKYYGSHITVYSKGMLKKRIRLPSVRAPQLILLFKDILVTGLFTLSTRLKYDLYIGVDCLNASVGILLKKLGIVGEVVFYAIDYTPDRFKNPLINGAYHAIEKFCVLHSDQTWNQSKRMIDIWVHLYGASQEKNIVVPNCYDTLETEKIPSEEINRFQIVYLGSLERSKGLELAIVAFPRILKEFPKATLLIIGTGPEESNLKALCKEKGLDDHVVFAGHIANRHKWLRMLSRCGLGIAPYLPSRLVKMNRYGDPGKVKAYLACGLPVVLTDAPEISSIVQRERVGIVIDYSVDSFVSAIRSLFADERLYFEYRSRALQFASKFNCNSVFGEAFCSFFRLADPKVL